MAQQTLFVDGRHSAPPHSDVVGHERDWRVPGVLSGFVATVLMTAVLGLAYLISSRFGEATGNSLQHWLYELTHNPLVSGTENRIVLAIGINLAVGLVFALGYARFFAPRLSGPGWLKGMAFSLLPWLLSIVAFFPLAGLGIFGLDIDAGPLPVIGNLIAHLVYGAVLGAMYAIPADAWLDDTDEDRFASIAAERGAVSGLLVGLVLGIPMGFAVSPLLAGLAVQTVIVLASSLMLGAVGLMIGSLMGIGDGAASDTTSR